MDSEQIAKEEISKNHKIRPSVRRYIDMLVLSLCALLIGAVTGVIVAVFGRVLIEITNFRTDNTYWLLPFLALAGFFIMKSPKPKWSVMALPMSMGSFLEFLSMNVPLNSAMWLRFSVSLDSMIMGR